MLIIILYLIFINNNQCWTAIKSKKHSYSEYAHKNALYFNKKKTILELKKKQNEEEKLKDMIWK